jgi:hypothetical protein
MRQISLSDAIFTLTHYVLLPQMLRRIIKPLWNQSPSADEDHITWPQATPVTCVLESQWLKQIRISKEEQGRGKGRKLVIKNPSRVQ